MTRQQPLPAAAIAVIAAAICEARQHGVRDDNVTARQAARALADAGWTLTLPGTPQAGTHAAA
jgi:hypothetical protein